MAIKLNKTTKILLLVLSIIVFSIATIKILKSNFFHKSRPVMAAENKAPRTAQIDLNAIFNQAEALIAQNRLDEALKLYQSALSQNQNNSKLHNDIGYILLEKNLLSDSEKHLILSIELDPNCSECSNNLGILRTRQKRALEAENNFKEAIILNETFPEPYYNLGVLYEKNGDIGNAIISYRDFLKHTPEKKSITYIQVENRILTLTGK
jgi:Flp pilus assembly protein TadD